MAAAGAARTGQRRPTWGARSAPPARRRHDRPCVDA